MCWRIARAIFVSIILIEAAILVPSYRNYERDLLLRLENVGLAAVSAALKKDGNAAPNALAALESSLTVQSRLKGAAIYDAGGRLLGSLGEPPELVLAEIGEERIGKARSADGQRYEVAWRMQAAGPPMTVIGRLDSSWIGGELVAFLFRIAGLVLLISAFVSGVTMVILGRSVLTPLLALRGNLASAGADPANADQFSLRARRNDELGDVIEAINELLRRVSRTYREELAMLAAMANEATDAILAYDAAGHVVYANRACLDLCGFADAEAMERANLPLLTFEGNELPLSLVDSLREGPYSSEATMLVNGGHGVPCLIRAARLESEGRRPVCYYAIATDISELSAAQERLALQNLELAAADRAKSEFLANVSHELRTPLNAIIGFSELIKSGTWGPIGDPRYLEYANDIHASGNHLLELISDILDLSKIEAGKLELSEQVVDIGRTLKSCLRLIKDRAEEGGIEVRNQAPKALPGLWADERKFKQIFLNLLSNAVKFTPAGHSVAVEVSADSASGVVIKVCDSGIGIAAEDITTALAPFRQIDSQLNRKFEGTGLGLPLAKRLVELHGGTLDIESEVGVGTTVTVCFPAERMRERAA